MTRVRRLPTQHLIIPMVCYDSTQMIKQKEVFEHYKSTMLKLRLANKYGLDHYECVGS